MMAGRRWLVAAPSLLGLGVLFVAASTTGFANISARDAAREIETWASLAGGPLPATAESVRQDLMEARKARPQDAFSFELLGVVAARDRAHPERLPGAIDDFKQALRLRPVSPYTWANLVHAYYEAGETGPEFERALRRAQELGPWEPEVQATLVHYGLAVREEIGPAARGSVDLAVASAMRRNPSETLQISERRGRLDVACAAMNWEAGAKRFPQCEQWEKKR